MKSNIHVPAPSAAGRVAGQAWRLPDRLEVTKVQLPNLYPRNLDKAWRCATLEHRSPSASAEGMCPSPRQGAVKGSLTIRGHRLVAGTESRRDYHLSSLAWCLLPAELTCERETRPVNVAAEELSCKPLGFNMLQGKVV